MMYRVVDSAHKFEPKPKQNILAKAAVYVVGLLKIELCEELLFHDVYHTVNMVKDAHTLGTTYGLKPSEMEVLLLSAWFHDTGYCMRYRGHEAKSFEIASEWLNRQGYPALKIRQVGQCIQATQLGSTSSCILGDIIADADMAHAGKVTFFDSAADLREEWELCLGQYYTDTEWAELQYAFLNNLQYHTWVAQMLFEQQLNRNKHLQWKRLLELRTIDRH